MADETTTTTELTANIDPGRKYKLTVWTILIVLGLGISGELLKRFTGIDCTDIFKWAMITVTAASGMGSASIAYDDAHTKQQG